MISSCEDKEVIPDLNRLVSKVFVINMAGAKNRWMNAYTQLVQNDIDLEKIVRQVGIPDPFLEGMRAGLSLAHYLCWSQIAEDENISVGLVCEDDILFHDDFAKLWPVYWKQVKSDWNVVFLGSIPDDHKIHEKPVLPATMFWCTHCILINKAGARLLCEKFAPYFAPQGDFKFNEEAIAKVRRENHPSPRSFYRWPIDYIMYHIHEYLSERDKQKWYTFTSCTDYPAKFHNMSFLLGLTSDHIMCNGLVFQNNMLNSHPDDVHAVYKITSILK